MTIAVRDELVVEAIWRSTEARGASADETAQYIESLHVEDLALAAACRAGDEPAWEHFVNRYRPLLHDAASRLVRDEVRARELADSIFAELYGLDERNGHRRSLFDYFHGRSSIATWLRAVLAQRHVDAIRAGARLESLDSNIHGEASAPAEADSYDPNRAAHLALLQRLLTASLAALTARDRLRLAYYYLHKLTLAQLGRLMGEHESSASRRLEGTRARIKRELERGLRREGGLSKDQVRQCFEYALEEAPIDLARVLDEGVAAGNPVSAVQSKGDLR